MSGCAAIRLVAILISSVFVAYATEVTYEKKISGSVALGSLERFYVKITESNLAFASYRVGAEPEVESFDISINQEAFRQLLTLEFKTMSGELIFRPLKYMSNEICETLTIMDNGRAIKLVFINREFLGDINATGKALLGSLERVTDFVLVNIMTNNEREKYSKLLEEIGSFKTQ